jgi:glycosyltransferase involved in cell wall biosynthesis
MHIGVSTQDFIGWGGGVGFIENLLFGLLAVPEQVTKITVFVPEKPGPMSNLVARVKRAVFEPSNAAQHLFGRTPSQEAWKMAPTLFARICPNVVAFDGSATTLSHLCQRLRVDILLPITKPSRNYGVPWVGYLADCQHRHYPKFFSAHEIAFRDRYFSNMLSDANVVIVNSRDAAADLDSFFPEGGAKIFALPFAPLLRSDNICNIISRTPLVKHKYATGDKYLMISNQFWIHKDHSTAFKAFALAVEDNALAGFTLVCTGAQDDYRFPDYFTEVQNLITSLHIKDRIIFTGYIDKLDQLALLNGATILLQPTLFEGGPGGGAAYDSVALGIPSLLSNIQVNLEIDDPTVTFFNARDVQSLSSAISSCIRTEVHRPSVNELIEKSSHNAKTLGRSVCAVAKETLQSFG